jgi:hypothetical protein
MAGTTNKVEREILEGVFVRRVLQDTARELDKEQRRIMRQRSFEQAEWYNGRRFDVQDGRLTYTHYGIHRFVDMKKRRLRDGGVIKKVAHPIHNRPLFGFANKIINELQYGFTESIKNKIRQDLDSGNLVL